MDTPTAKTPATVPLAQQAGDVRSRWDWAEAAVWTERMLTTLETGVKGSVWFRLIDKVFAERNLRAAFTRVKANHGGPGIDQVSVDDFAAHLDDELARLSAALRQGTYYPQAIRRVYMTAWRNGRRRTARRKGRSSVRSWPTSTWTRSTTCWPSRVSRWCVTRTTS